jgi:hypothetical protein
VLRRHSHATHPFPAGCQKFVARRSDFEGSSTDSSELNGLSAVRFCKSRLEIKRVAQGL